jgi:hypothetical protein
MVGTIKILLTQPLLQEKNGEILLGEIGSSLSPFFSSQLCRSRVLNKDPTVWIDGTRLITVSFIGPAGERES